MYAQFFGLRELPFNNTPDPRFFFSTPDHEEALALLVYAVGERKDFALLTGEVGAGKTLVSRMMLRHFGARVTFAIINHTVHDVSDLLESVCTEFGLPVEKGASHSQLVRTLHDFLLAQFAKNTPVVLVLDEAQNLPMAAFEQLRMIGNLESDDAKLMQTLILGQPELQQTIASPQLRQLRQRIFRTFHLPALSRESTEGYIRHRLSVAGSTDLDLFDQPAIDAIHAASEGVPRVINTLCDNALLGAYSADRRKVDGPFMEAVVTQLQWEPRHRRKASLTAGAPIAPEYVAAAPAPSHAIAGFDEPAPPAARARAVNDHRGEEFGAAIAELTRRLHRIEQRLDVTPIRSDHSAPNGATANTLIARVESACRELQRRELQMTKLSSGGQALLDELARVLRTVERATTEAKSAAREVLDIRERTASRTQLRPMGGADPGFAATNTDARIIRTREAPVQRPARSMASADHGCGQFDRLLSQTEASLTALRTLARRSTNGARATASAGVASRTAAEARRQSHLPLTEPGAGRIHSGVGMPRHSASTKQVDDAIENLTEAVDGLLRAASR